MTKDMETVVTSLEARLEVATNANQVLLETLSHDLRTPLNTIIGFADMMEQEILGPVDNKHYRSYVSDICGSGRQMLEILHDVLERQRFEQIEKSETDFRHMFELAPDLISICRDGKILRMNPAGANLLGLWPVDTLIGRSFGDFVHDDFKPLVADGLHRLTDRTTRLPMKLYRAGGTEVDVELAAVPYDDPDSERARSADTVLLIARDVTERNRAISRVAASEYHVRRIMDTVVEGIVTTDQNGLIETINPAAELIFAYDAGDLVGQDVRTLMSPEHQAGFDDTMSRFAETGESEDMGRPREIGGIRRNGTVVAVEISLTAMKSRGRYTFIAVIHDITERKLVEARLVELATRDPLTKLPNRPALTAKLNQMLAGAQDAEAAFAVLFVDLDNFRHINETRGHVVADQVIEMTGERLQQCVQSQDTVAHFGGDEFMVVLDGVSGDEEAETAGEIIREVIAQPYFVGGKEVYVTASIGVAMYPADGDNVSELMKNADTALHHVKTRQRGTLAFYAPELTANIGHWVRLEAGLRRALANNELFLNFQPKIDLESGNLIGAEALVRWNSSEMGYVPPDEFVPIAEETGLVGPIGEWVLVEACRQAVIWNNLSDAPIHVGVNVSAHQMKQGDMGDKVKLSLEETGLDPRLLELELTESVMLDNSGKMIATLEELRSLGITVAIDDFGTGYSSLSYLTSFPLDTLKVDRAFVMNLPDDRDAVAIARAIVGMAKSLDLHVVAEGIETGNQEGFLNALGCHTGQGYLFSKPLSDNAFLDLITSNVVPLKVPC